MEHRCEECEFAYIVSETEGSEQHLICTQHYRSLVAVETEDEVKDVWTDHTGVPCKKWKPKTGIDIYQQVYRGAMLDKFKAMRAPKKSGSKRRKKR